MNLAETVMLSTSAIAIVATASAVATTFRGIFKKNEFIEENIIPYINSLDYNELVIVADAIVLSLNDSNKANLFKSNIEIIDLFLSHDDNVNEVVCEKLRDLINERIFSFSSKELEAFKVNYSELKKNDKVYKKQK